MSSLLGTQRHAVPVAYQAGFPPIEEVRRVILEVLADGRARPAAEIRQAVAARFGMPASTLNRTHQGSGVSIWTNWHAHGLKTLQNEWDPALGDIIKDKVTRLYRISASGRKVVRETPLPAGALRGEAAVAVATFEMLAGKQDALETARRKKGQGAQLFRLSAEERTALEQYAVNAAIKHFEEKGYVVYNVGSTESYDLRCYTATSELHVEVKGTETDGSNIPLTPNEVLHARSHRPLALYVLSNISIKTRNGKLTCSGGVPHIHDPWRIDKDGELRPVGYLYARRLKP
jgi:Domain of unknown function (DUF3883)